MQSIDLTVMHCSLMMTMPDDSVEQEGEVVMTEERAEELDPAGVQA
jgi:hypothetical protein